MRGGDRARADRLLGEFRRFAPDTTWIGPLAAMVDCVRSGGSRYDWTPAVRPPGLILKAAKYFPLEGSSGGCAEGGFRAVLASPAAGQGERWGATLGLQSLLLAEGRAHEVKPVLDSAIANGNPAAAGLYLVDAAAGYGMESDAARVAESLSGPYRRMKAPGLWYLGVWAYHEGAAARLDSLTGAITAVADTGSGTDSLLAAAVAARRDLLRADTAAALRRLRGISPLSPLDDLQWGISGIIRPRAAAAGAAPRGTAPMGGGIPGRERIRPSTAGDLLDVPAREPRDPSRGRAHAGPNGAGAGVDGACGRARFGGHRGPGVLTQEDEPRSWPHADTLEEERDGSRGRRGQSRPDR